MQKQPQQEEGVGLHVSSRADAAALGMAFPASFMPHSSFPQPRYGDVLIRLERS